MTMPPQLTELRLFVEELCYNLCRFQHVVQDGLASGDVRIHQEVYLGTPGAFADIRVTVRGAPSYFVEVKFGYPHETIIQHIRRKCGAATDITRSASKVVVVVDARTEREWPEIESELRTTIWSGLGLEIWNEDRLIALMRERFDIRVDAIRENALNGLRTAIDGAMGRYAFGDQYSDDLLHSSLLWHFGFWRLRELRETHQLGPQTIMPPRLYQGVAVLFADLCS